MIDIEKMQNINTFGSLAIFLQRPITFRTYFTVRLAFLIFINVIIISQFFFFCKLSCY